MRIRRVDRDARWSLRRMVVVATVPALVAAGLMLSATADPARSKMGDVLNVSGRTLDGESLSIADYRNRVVVVNIWASWCAECVAEAPVLRAVWETVRDVSFVGINVQDTRAEALSFREEHGLAFPSLFDPSGEIRLDLRALVPSTFVVDPSGRIAFRRLGSITEEALRAAIDRVRAGTNVRRR